MSEEKTIGQDWINEQIKEIEGGNASLLRSRDWPNEDVLELLKALKSAHKALEKIIRLGGWDKDILDAFVKINALDK